MTKLTKGNAHNLLGNGWKVIAVDKPGWSHFLSAIVGFEKKFFVAYPVFPKNDILRGLKPAVSFCVYSKTRK